MKDLTKKYLDLTEQTETPQVVDFQKEVDLWRKESIVDSQYHAKSKSNQRILQLRWNFEEFEVHLNQINEMIPVNDYYLKILIDESLQTKSYPFLTEERVNIN
jgi:hypothetical protein